MERHGCVDDPGVGLQRGKPDALEERHRLFRGPGTPASGRQPALPASGCATADGVECGRFVLPASEVPAQPWLVGAGVSNQWFEPGGDHCARRGFRVPSSSRGSALPRAALTAMTTSSAGGASTLPALHGRRRQRRRSRRRLASPGARESHGVERRFQRSRHRCSGAGCGHVAQRRAGR